LIKKEIIRINVNKNQDSKAIVTGTKYITKPLNIAKNTYLIKVEYFII